MKRAVTLTWIVRAGVVLICLWIAFVATVAAAMMQPPERFGLFMRHVPMILVWGATPAQHIWLWARKGTLKEGDVAPDFTLSSHDHKRQVTLSSSRGKQPVVLVFGSYT
jgi:hypothetical protein